MKKKTLLFVPLFFLTSSLLAVYISASHQFDQMTIEILLILFTAHLYLYTLLPAVFKRIVQRCGLQSIAYIHHATSTKEFVFERQHLRANRIDVTLEVLDADGQPFHAKSTEYFKELGENAIGAHQLIVVRYLPFFKKYVVFDALYHEFHHDMIIPHVVQKRTSTKNATYSL